MKKGQKQMENKELSLPDESSLVSRQNYVQRFTLIYSTATLTFSMYFTPQDFNLKTAVIVNTLLFLIGAPFWFRKSSISAFHLNLISQISNALASVWICSFLGPTSHINLVAIPQFILVFMMFGGKHHLATVVLGFMCAVQLSLPLFPFVNTWYLEKRMPEEHLVIFRELIDLTILVLSFYQFRAIAGAWQDALQIANKDKKNLQVESEWRFRLLRILSHDIKEPMVSALQLLRKLRRNTEDEQSGKLINQLENSQLMIREIISNVETYASAHESVSLPKNQVSPSEVMEKLAPWLKSRLEEKSITIDHSGVNDAHSIPVNPESFIYQVFLNLLSNAIKFSPPGSKITFSTAQDANGVYWKLSDQGKGINPIALTDANFTEPGTSGESGSGLGIKIAQLIASKQAIDLQWRVLSESQRGTEVTISVRASETRQSNGEAPVK